MIAAGMKHYLVRLGSKQVSFMLDKTTQGELTMRPLVELACENPGIQVQGLPVKICVNGHPAAQDRQSVGDPGQGALVHAQRSC